MFAMVRWIIGRFETSPLYREAARHAPQVSNRLSSKNRKENDATVGAGTSAGNTTSSALTAPAAASGVDNSKAHESLCCPATRLRDATAVPPSLASTEVPSVMAPLVALTTMLGGFDISTISVPTPRIAALASIGALPPLQRPFTKHVRPGLQNSHQLTASTTAGGT